MYHVILRHACFLSRSLLRDIHNTLAAHHLARMARVTTHCRQDGSHELIESESGTLSLTFDGADILPVLMGMVEDSVSPKYTERLVREALEGVGVELRAKAEVSDEQLKALVPKLEALFYRENVHWRIPLKLRAAAGLADEQEQSDLRWAGESKRAGLTMGPRPPPSESVGYTPPRVQRPPPRAHQPEQRFRKLHPRIRSPPMHELSKEPPEEVTAYVKQCILAVERLSNICRLQRHRVERSPPPVVRQAACRARTGTDVGPLPVKKLDFETVRNAIAAVGYSAPPTPTVAASVPAVRTHPRPEPPRALHLLANARAHVIVRAPTLPICCGADPSVRLLHLSERAARTPRAVYFVGAGLGVRPRARRLSAGGRDH